MRVRCQRGLLAYAVAVGLTYHKPSYAKALKLEARMPREPRLRVAGSVYQVMLRGNGGQRILFAKTIETILRAMSPQA